MKGSESITVLLIHLCTVLMHQHLYHRNIEMIRYGNMKNLGLGRVVIRVQVGFSVGVRVGQGGLYTQQHE